MYEINYTLKEKRKKRANNIYLTLGASNHTNEQRQGDDYYATAPVAAIKLLENEQFCTNVWECACGGGHLSDVFVKAGYHIRSSDLVNRNYGEIGIDFLSNDIVEWDGDIVTNPPYKFAQQFIEKALAIVPAGNKVAMLLRLQFLEGKKRQKMFKQHPPKTVYVFSSRLQCAKNAEFEEMNKRGGSALAYAWYVWEKDYVGNPAIKWLD